MTLPVLRQKNAAQIGMAVEDDANEIKCFTFMPICCAPNTRDRRNVWVPVIEQHFQSQPMKFLRREQVIIYLETRLFLRTSIDTTQISKKVELSVRIALQK